jgi:hypothetical protein
MAQERGDSDVAEDLSRFQYIQNLEPHSVEISRNAKGEFSFSVKIYGSDENDAMERAYKIAEELHRRTYGSKA